MSEATPHHDGKPDEPRTTDCTLLEENAALRRRVAQLRVSWSALAKQHSVAEDHLVAEVDGWKRRCAAADDAVAAMHAALQGAQQQQSELRVAHGLQEAQLMTTSTELATARQLLALLQRRQGGSPLLALDVTAFSINVPSEQPDLRCTDCARHNVNSPHCRDATTSPPLPFADDVSDMALTHYDGVSGDASRELEATVALLQQQSADATTALVRHVSGTVAACSVR